MNNNLTMSTLPDDWYDIHTNQQTKTSEKDIADAYTNMITNSYRLAVSDPESFLKNIQPINKGHNILPKIKKVIFNPPATIVLWEDNIKTVVKCQKDEMFDPEKALAMAISKRALGNKGNYYNIFKKYTTPLSIIVTSIKDFCTKLSELADKQYIQHNKYGDRYDSRLYFASKRHKIVCAGTCYHVKNIKKENALVYATYNDAIKDGCIPCKHCNGVSEYPLSTLLSNVERCKNR